MIMMLLYVLSCDHYFLYLYGIANLYVKSIFWIYVISWVDHNLLYVDHVKHFDLFSYISCHVYFDHRLLNVYMALNNLIILKSLSWAPCSCCIDIYILMIVEVALFLLVSNIPIWKHWHFYGIHLLHIKMMLTRNELMLNINCLMTIIFS